MLKPKIAPPATEARTKLREAVATHREAQAAVGRVVAAHERAQHAVLAAHARIDEAEIALTAAQHVDVDALVDAAIMDNPPPVRQISERAARETLADAQAELIESRRLRDALAQRIEQTTQSAWLAERARADAARSVMAEEAEPISKWLDETLAMIGDLRVRRREFDAMKQAGFLDGFPDIVRRLGLWLPSRGNPFEDRAPMSTEAREFLASLRKPEMSRRIQAAFEALCADADVPVTLR